MQQLLDAGYTTILSGGGPAEGNLTLKDHIEKGVIKGPRIIPSGRVDLGNNTPDAARAEVRRLAALGIKFIGEQALTPKPGPTAKELENLRAIVDESKKVGVWVQIHAVSPQSMMAAVDAGVPKLVHTPHFGWLSFEDAKRVAAAGVKQLSTIGFGVPVFGVFADDNKPRFRDGKPWPESILDGDGRGQEAGYKAVNARTSWDAGVVYGYGTDTGYAPKAGLEHELKSLNLMFSMQDIVKLMGPNTASYIEMSDAARHARGGQAGRHRSCGRQPARRLLEPAEYEAGDQGRRHRFGSALVVQKTFEILNSGRHAVATSRARRKVDGAVAKT